MARSPMLKAAKERNSGFFMNFVLFASLLLCSAPFVVSIDFMLKKEHAKYGKATEFCILYTAHSPANSESNSNHA